MRVRAIVATVACLLGGSVSFAEPSKRVATVEVDGVEIRSGHALAYPSVGTLKKGTSIIVLREEETGFYAIQPPPGSLSWIKAIHLGKVELNEAKKANVPVAVPDADVAAGSDLVSGPSSRITTRLPQGTIVEIIGGPQRVDNATWYPITPPDGDVRWVPKSAVKTATMVALAPPPIYNRPDPPTYSAGPDPTRPPEVKAGMGNNKLPAALTNHKLWAQATQAELQKDYATAKGLYARIYHDLWDAKADRDAIVICYNRHNRCDEMLKQGAAPIPKAITPPTNSTEARREESAPLAETKWSGPGMLREVTGVIVDGLQVYALQDDRGQVLYYTTGVAGTNLKPFNGRRVQLYGVVTNKPTLYKPHMAVERVESAR